MRVCIVGHSQVPTSLDIPNGTVTVFRKPGARVLNWRETSELTEVFNHTFDLTFIWLGSNDINESCVPKHITTELNRYAQEVERRCHTKVVLIEVETRSYRSSPHFVCPLRYLHIRRSINTNLHFQRRFSLLSFGALKFELARDGVHFTSHSKQLIKQRFIDMIAMYRSGRRH